MGLRAPAPIKAPNIQRKSIMNWLKGVVTALDDGRTPTDGLRAVRNVMLDQDGTVRPRPSMVRYGTQPTGTVLGEVFEFVKANGTVNENYMLTMQNVSGTTKIYVAKDGGAWTLCNGKTYDNSALAHYSQIDNKVLITNGVDNLSYLDIPTLTVVPFVALTTPAAPTLTTNTGLIGTTLTYYYKITANSTVGETAASTALAVQVSTDRDYWIPTTPQNLLIAWTAVTNATSYNVYLATTTGGPYYLLSAGVNGLSFKDDGSLARNVAAEAPAADTTQGPRATRSSVINGQAFLTGDADNTRYVRFGGNGASVLDFSPFNGGGYTEIGRGTKEVPVRVMSFRDGQGNSQVTVLCRGTNGTGKRYIMSPQTLTVGSTVISFFEVTEDNGQDGTDSPDGVILYRDSLWYPSRDGFKTTGTKPQLQNLLSTDSIAETILNDVKVLNNAYMDKCVGLAWQNRLYWAVPNGSTTNNEIWVLDLARQGAWMKPWNISASWMMMYNDNDGLSHQIILSNNVIYELSDATATTDDGVGFSTNITSGLIKFSEDSLEWAKVIDITFILLRPQGAVSFVVSGRTEDTAQLETIGTSSFTTDTTVAGWGESGWGGSPGAIAPQKAQIYGWSIFSVVPTSFGDAQELVTIEVDEELEWLSYEVDSGTPGTFYQLADVIIRFVPIGVKDLS